MYFMYELGNNKQNLNSNSIVDLYKIFDRLRENEVFLSEKLKNKLLQTKIISHLKKAKKS